MFTVKEYYTRKILGTFATRKAAYLEITKLCLMVHHSKGHTIIAIS